jgi:hypothetical protein
MKNYKIYIYYFILIIPIIIYYGLFFRYTVNAPINDDYRAVLDFINKIISVDTIFDKLKILFSQHNEHRIVYGRLWTVISYNLLGNVNFNFLSFVGNLSLLGLSVIFYKRFSLLQKPVLLFLPVMVLLFNITSWENMTFTMAVLSNFTVYLFIFISLKYITSNTLENKKNLYFSFLFLFLAVITQGGGLFLIPISILILLYKKEYKNIIIFGILCIMLIALYFYNYESPQQNIGVLNSVLEYKVKIILFAFAFLGNAFNYYTIYDDPKNSILLTTIIGGILFLLFLYITYTKYFKKNLFNYSLMLLLIMSAFITALSRISLGIETASASRYRINGILFFITLYFWFIETRKFSKTIHIYLIVSVSSIYFIFINLGQNQYLYVREKQTYFGILNYNYGNVELLNGEKVMVNFYADILVNSKKLETYVFPSNEKLENYFPFSETIIVNKSESGDSSAFLSNITESISIFPDSYFIEGWAFLEGYNTDSQQVYVGIKNSLDEKPTYYLAKQTKRYDLTPYFKKLYLNDGGYSARINSSYLKKGVNKIWIMLINENQTKIQETDKIITK